jgi:hypothetical protein
MSIEELIAEDARLWAIVRTAQAAQDKALNEWLPIRHKLVRIREKEELRAELWAELLAKRPAVTEAE